MSFVVVLIVAGAVFLYLRATRQARAAWIERIDLPGRWQWQGGDAELVIHGKGSNGQFELNENGQTWRGSWRLRGHALLLASDDRQELLDLHFVKPGSIGLEDTTGVRRLFAKVSTNVVPLRPSERRAL